MLGAAQACAEIALERGEEASGYDVARIVRLESELERLLKGER